jgi:hypothetical protein
MPATYRHRNAGTTANLRLRPADSETRPGWPGGAREHGGLYDAEDPGPREPDGTDSVEVDPLEADPCGADGRSGPTRPRPTVRPAHTETDEGEVGPSLRDAIDEVARGMARVVELAGDDSRPGGGELGGLLDLAGVIDRAHAAAVELTGRVQAGSVAERKTSLPLEQLMAFRTRLSFGDRRMLATTADVLQSLPNIRVAFSSGELGWSEIRQIVVEARPLTLAQRAELDADFADTGWLTRREADRVVDHVRERTARIRPDKAAERAARRMENRFLSLQPMLDGGGTGYFEFDEEAFATVAAGLEAAMPAPSAGPKDVTRDAVGHAHPDDLDEDEAADGEPAFLDSVAFRSRARQRADALVTLAETFLSGSRADGTVRRARPRVRVVADINDLTGHSDAATAARLLIDTVGMKPHITAEAARRLAEDADLQLIIKQHGHIVGVSAPTEAIPAKVRAACTTRDQGCRFPGCRMPVSFTDLHHVLPREHGGPTVISNLVSLCRRHHTAVHEGGWKLDLHHNGAVTIRRGRITHTSDPP